jgi:hypothetical protein
MTPEQKAAQIERLMQHNDRQARRAAKRVGLAMHKTRPRSPGSQARRSGQGRIITSWLGSRDIAQ